MHWPVSRIPTYTLEATAYALLALVKAKVIHLSIYLSIFEVYLSTYTVI